MASVNKAILIGNLGKDPELRYTPSGQAVASFPLATTERYKDKDGNWQERTDWHNIVVWGRQGETTKEYLSKGCPIPRRPCPASPTVPPRRCWPSRSTASPT